MGGLRMAETASSRFSLIPHLIPGMIGWLFTY